MLSPDLFFAKPMYKDHLEMLKMHKNCYGPSGLMHKVDISTVCLLMRLPRNSDEVLLFFHTALGLLTFYSQFQYSSV